MKNATERFELAATTLQYLEPLLEAELRSLGANDVQTGKRVVYFTGDLDLVYKANLRRRLALRILRPLHSYVATNTDELYAGAQRFDWSSLFDASKTFAINTTLSGETFTHSQFATLRVKDAIVDHFRNSSGARPSIDTANPHISLHLHIRDDRITLSHNTSGEPLNRRGYRAPDALAPLNEVLAAAMIDLTEWPMLSDFYDPMCGSGTLVLEAALKAHQIAPGLLREDFSFMHTPEYDQDLFAHIREATVGRIRDHDFAFYASDKSSRALQQARESARTAQLDDEIRFAKTDFFLSNPKAERGIVVTNPPYEMRVQTGDIFSFYEEMGNKLKRDYPGFTAWILSGNPDAMKHFGLRPTRRIALLNGAIPCTFFKFDLYEGTRRRG